MKENKDLLERRCPRLGNPVTFYYCRTCSEEGTPCSKILDCWWEYFDVMSFLRKKLPEDVFKKLVTIKPKPKITNLLDLIEKAKKRTENL